MSEKLVPKHILQNPLYVENLGNWYSYFSNSIGVFFPLDSHSMVYFIMCEIRGFPHQLPVAWENAVKSIKLGVPGNLVPIFSLTYGYFYSIRFPFYCILCYHMGMHGFFHQNPLCELSGCFSQYYFFYLNHNLLIP